MQCIEFRAMGSRVFVAAESDSPLVREHLARVPTWFAEWEQVLSRFRDDSELARLNSSAGAWVPVGPVLWEVLQAALDAAHWSNGLVTPTLLAALEASGYVCSFDAGGQALAGHNGTAPASVPPSLNDWLQIRCDPATRSVWLPPAMRLDLGGIAKGWAADQTLQALCASGPLLVDAGGDIALSGPQLDGSPWPIGVANPACPAEALALLLIGRGGVATSGRDYRRWRHNGTWQHHILDPRTGQPAQTDVVSATVVAPTAATAEAAAKTVLILGSRAGLAWLERQPAYAGLLILEDGALLQSSRMQAYLWQE